MNTATRKPIQSLGSVRAAIENKDTEKAVQILKDMYPQGLQRPADVERVAQWLSLFLLDETVSLYEKAVELSTKKEASAEDYFRRALAKEPHNKILHQTLIAFLMDQSKTKDALAAIELAEKNYPYFKIFSLYKRYLVPPTGAIDDKKTLREQKNCGQWALSTEEGEFCRTVFLREVAKNRAKLDKKTLDEQRSITSPEALFSLWEMTSNMEYLKQYVTKCQGRSDQEKRSARLFPGVCSKVTDVEALLKTEDPEE